jgi:hypothetical protein
MIWFWMNIPFAAACFLAWTLIPLWIVIKRPDRSPQALGQDKRTTSRGTPLTAPRPSRPHAPATHPGAVHRGPSGRLHEQADQHVPR